MALRQNTELVTTKVLPFWKTGVGVADIPLAVDDASVPGITDLCAQLITVVEIPAAGKLVTQDISGRIDLWTAERIRAFDGTIVGQFKKILVTGTVTEDGASHTSTCFDLLVEW